MVAPAQQDWRDKDEHGKVRRRFDFEFETMMSDEQAGAIVVRTTPHSRRYDLITVKGERHYRDRYLSEIIPEAEIIKMMVEQQQAVPIIYNPPSISSAYEYTETRQKALNAEFSGEAYRPPAERAKPHAPLNEAGGTRFLTFLSVDICASSALRRKEPAGFEKAYGIFLRELATSVGHFHGRILKTTGDGFIAYIDSEGFTTQCDNTVDLGLTFLAVLNRSVNPELENAGLPQLQIRVGADCGAATIRRISVPATGFEQVEIASDALNRAVKIEQCAKPGELRIGRGLYELVHVQWLERCKETAFNGEEVGILGYQVYKVN
ncbi:adenylate/guanylate cyclase domain-containing protein [Altererythrobacter sp. C41]|uniref:adenylate/guanylate cyclase domain-containing protein n=1 Tax=Altererythrobacter sp. C41 TaxID=2806021 RepID=UPI0019339AE9|nr:adenylate/guanylate cyclase domain-containing protein [Altererythrobacter sp. C41]MBM0169514.1 hypothetical protein [Altererythrobacter sp. C41]